MTAVVDAVGRALSLPTVPRRIVSLVPSITDTLFAFGAGDRIGGVTKFCVEPKEGVAGKAKVGGTKDPDVGQILALEPDLVLANVEENRREDIEALIQAGVNVFVTYPRTVAEGIAMMRQIAGLTGAEECAAPIIEDCERELRLAEERNRPPRVFCPIWRNPWMTIGPDTYMHDFLRACGAENIFAAADPADRYPLTTLDEVARLEPEVILLPDEPYRFRERHVPELTSFAEVPAVRDGRIHLVAGKLLCWYGPRIAAGLRLVRGLLRGDNGNVGELDASTW